MASLEGVTLLAQAPAPDPVNVIVASNSVFFGKLNVYPTPIMHQANRELQPPIADDAQSALQEVTNPGDVKVSPQPDSVKLETATDSILVNILF